MDVVMLGKRVFLPALLLFYSSWSLSQIADPQFIDHAIQHAACDKQQLHKLELEIQANSLGKELQEVLNKQRWLCKLASIPEELTSSIKNLSAKPQLLAKSTGSIDVTPPEFRGIEFSVS